MKRRILTIDDVNDEELLRTPAPEVAAGDIGTTRIQSIVRDLKDTLDSVEVGIAIAAPQIGESLRIFVVSPKAFKEGATHLVCINPKLVKASRDRKALEEGCLSIPGIAGMVRRSTRVTLRATDEHGNAFERGASGLLAQIFQHEYDHLEGILFTDKATELRSLVDSDEELLA